MPRRLDLHPYLFRPILKEKIWGGARLKSMLGKRGPGRRIGESWELADRGRDTTAVAAGPMRGTSLRALLQTWPREILGEEHALRHAARFPLLVKFLDCDGMLSVQAHPPDEFARRHEDTGDPGKMEAWVVLHAEPDAVMIRGVLPGTTAAEFREAALRGTVEPCLNRIDVAAGDVIFLPPGTVHAAGRGVVLAEVSQNSDLTYRIHDWGQTDARGRPRPLHIDKAVAVIDFYSLGVSKHKPIPIPGQGCRRRLMLKCEKFTMESIEVEGRRGRIKHGPDRFRILVAIEGRGEIGHGKGGAQRTPFRAGQTFLIPARLGDFHVASRGRAKLLHIYI
jgi:mannose-6-phosphate isomerase